MWIFDPKKPANPHQNLITLDYQCVTNDPVAPSRMRTQSARNSEYAYKCMTGNQCSSEDKKKRRRWRRDMGWQTMCDERRSQTLRLLISERYRKS
mgnify:CR=1 FL=1